MLNFDRSKIKSGETIAVALSGGMDSVCLLYCLLKAKEKLNIQLVAINVDHGIRGESSVSDSKFCRELCEKLNVPLFFYKVDTPTYAKENGLSIEEAARKLRYNCFFDCIEKHNCDKVAVAHHLADNAETILFNIFRGSSLSGASGISNIEYNNKIIRPFLNVSKEEVRLYVDKHTISYVTDETNDDEKYTRNYIRLNVLPVIKTVFPKVEDSLSRFAESCKQDDEYLYELAKESLKYCNSYLSISCQLKYPIFARAVVLALKHFGVKKDYTKTNIDVVWGLTTSQTGKMINLPQGVLAIRDYDNIIIKNSQEMAIKPVSFAFGSLKVGNYDIQTKLIEKSQVVFGNGLYFDLDKLPKDAVVRRKQDGDRFIKFNGQNVSLKKFLVGKKLSDYQKSNLWVVAKENLVYIIINVEISRLLMIDNDTKNIVKLTCKDTWSEEK